MKNEQYITNGLRAPKIRVECPVEPISLDPLPEIVANIPGARPIASERYHVTFVALTSPTATFRKLAAITGSMTQEAYRDSMERLREGLVNLPIQNINVVAKGLLIGGGAKRYLLLSLRKTREIRDIHQCVYEQVSTCFRNMGVLDIEAFMMQTYDLRYFAPDRFRPHITLAEDCFSIAKPPDLEVAGKTIILKAPTLLVERCNFYGKY